NPDMSEMKGMTYLDTIQGYAAPRIMCALDLAGSPCDPNSVLETEVSMKVFPNPSQGLFSIQLGNQETIRLMEVFDMMGKRVLTFNPNASFTTIDLTSVPNGMYTIRMKTDGAALSTRVQKM
ncbi:MAG: T9SS type A sorting domain-containing protein, partial [Flavobacteriales bacterium]